MQKLASRFKTLAVTARVIWAKSGEGAGHSLLAHLLDVAAVVETVLERESLSTLRWAAEQFGLPPKNAARWIAAIAGLHDFGKAIPGFQAKWAEGMQADQSHGLDFNARACDVTDHSCATAALLKDALKGVADLELDWRRHVVQAISAHHGYHFSSSEVRKAKPIYEAPGWSEARRIILETYWAVLSPDGSPSLDALTTPAVNWLAGLTSVADWIASNPEWFPLGERHDELREYYAHARQLAVQALEHIGWSSVHSLLNVPTVTDELLGRIVGRPGSLPARPLQQVGDHLLQNARGPALLLVEAPMGEGKTGNPTEK